LRRFRKTIILGISFYTAFIFLSFSCSPNQTPDKWIFLGLRQFDERNDTAVIRLGPSEGAFSCLRFEISGPVELNWVIVFFENGERWSPNEGLNIRQGLGPGDQEFDLPSDEQIINRIEFRCILKDFTTSAGAVKVYGLREVN
jgi:hypothetical protein